MVSRHFNIANIIFVYALSLLFFKLEMFSWLHLSLLTQNTFNFLDLQPSRGRRIVKSNQLRFYHGNEPYAAQPRLIRL